MNEPFTSPDTRSPSWATAESLNHLMFSVMAALATLDNSNYSEAVEILDAHFGDNHASTPIDETTKQLLGKFWLDNNRIQEINDVLKSHDTSAEGISLEESIIVAELYQKKYTPIIAGVIILAFRDRKRIRQLELRMQQKSLAIVAGLRNQNWTTSIDDTRDTPPSARSET